MHRTPLYGMVLHSDWIECFRYSFRKLWLTGTSEGMSIVGVEVKFCDPY